MNAVARLSDAFARGSLTVLHAAGLRVGELLDLELGSIVDHGPVGIWLKVPLGNLAAESAGLRAPGGGALVLTPDSRVTPGHPNWPMPSMRLQALMALLGHVTPQMTLRYATSPHRPCAPPRGKPPTDDVQNPRDASSRGLCRRIRGRRGHRECRPHACASPSCGVDGEAAA